MYGPSYYLVGKAEKEIRHTNDVELFIICLSSWRRQLQYFEYTPATLVYASVLRWPSCSCLSTFDV